MTDKVKQLFDGKDKPMEEDEIEIEQDVIDDAIEDVQDSGTTIMDVKQIAKEFLFRCRKDYDVVCCISGVEGTGKSVHKNTKIVIIDKNGNWSFPTISEFYKIAEINKDKYYTLSLNKETLKVERKEIKAVLKHKSDKELIEIKTKGGRQVIITSDHSLIHMKDTKVEELSGGNINLDTFLPILSNIGIGGKKKVFEFDYYKKPPHATNTKIIKKLNLNEKTGFLIGAYLSEGCIDTSKGKIMGATEITSIDKIFNNRTVNSLNEIGLKGRTVNYDNKIKGISFSNMCISHMLYEEFGNNSGNKRIPGWVFNSNKSFIKGVLSGYFSGDGSINCRGEYGFRGSMRRDLSATSKSLDLIKGINLLLTMFKINSTLCERTVKDYGKFYVMSIISEDMKMFKDNIPIYHKKRKELEVMCKPHREFSQVKKIPLTKEVLKIINNGRCLSKRGSESRKEITKLRVNTIRCKSIGLGVSYNYDCLDGVEYIEKVRNGDVFWTNLKSIETKCSTSDYVYDLSIKDNENFMLDNGLFVHNSSLANAIGIEVGKIIKHDFDLMKNVLYNPNEKEMTDKVLNLPKYSAINVDEAIKVLYKLDWNTQGQRYLNKLYAIARKENKITLLCMPNFYDLSPYWRKHRVFVWIHLIVRGLGIMMIRDTNPFTSDPYWQRENQKIVDKFIKKGGNNWNACTLDFKLSILSKTRNFAGVIRFDKLEPEFEKEYQRLRDKYKYSTNGEEDGEAKEILRDRREKALDKTLLMLQRLGIKQKEIAEATGYTHANVSRRIKHAKKNEKLNKLISIKENSKI